MRSTGRTRSSGDLLDAATREKLVAVVVDANSYGAVGPDLNRLVRLAADLAKIDIKLWIPEPVAWEWAEHLGREWITIRNLAKDALRNLANAGLPEAAITPAYGSREDVVAAFLDRLTKSPHIEIIPLTGESAVAGLKDQILQTKPAKTKSADAVKTGGSDSAWLRDVLVKAGSANSLLFLSKDGDIKAAYTAWGHAPPLMRSASAVRSALFDDVPATVDDQWTLARYLVGRMPANLDGPASDAEGTLVGTEVGLLDEVDTELPAHGVTSGSLTQLTTFAGLIDVVCEAPELHEPDRPPKQRTIRATAFFLADAVITGVYSSDDRDEVQNYTSSHTDLLVCTRLVFSVEGTQVVGVRPDSETAVLSSSAELHDSYDGVELVLEALSTVPGLAKMGDVGGWWESGETEIEVEHSGQTITLLWSQGEGNGALGVFIGDDEASVECEYDDDAWVGGRDGTFISPPYYLTVETPDAVSGSPWLLSSWVIKQLVAHSEAAGIKDAQQAPA